MGWISGSWWGAVEHDVYTAIHASACPSDKPSVPLYPVSIHPIPLYRVPLFARTLANFTHSSPPQVRDACPEWAGSSLVAVPDRGLLEQERGLLQYFLAGQGIQELLRGSPAGRTPALSVTVLVRRILSDDVDIPWS